MQIPAKKMFPSNHFFFLFFYSQETIFLRRFVPPPPPSLETEQRDYFSIYCANFPSSPHQIDRREPECFIPRRRQEKFEHIFPPYFPLVENCRLKLSGARSTLAWETFTSCSSPLGCIFHGRNEEQRVARQEKLPLSFSENIGRARITVRTVVSFRFET